jgi:hypothetical protein
MAIPGFGHYSQKELAGTQQTGVVAEIGKLPGKDRALDGATGGLTEII